MVRRPSRSPTDCARAPRASSPPPRPLASSRSCLRGRLSSLRGLLDRSRNRKDPALQTQRVLRIWGGRPSHLLRIFLVGTSVNKAKNSRTPSKHSGPFGRGHPALRLSPPARHPSGRRVGEPMAQVDWATTLTIQLVPNRSTHKPNVSPQGAFSNGTVTLLPSLRRSQ